MSSHFDVIILGQGLAGTALAWSLRWMGARFLVIDREEPVTSSKIAAGLMTPITGQKLTRTWKHRELWAAAECFYQRVEKETNSQFFRRISMVRLFGDSQEAAMFERRLATREFDGCPLSLFANMNPEWFASGLSGFEMNDGGKLNVPLYLAVSRQTFLDDGLHRHGDLDVSRDISMVGKGVSLPRFGVTATRLVFCQGFDASPNPWFRDVRLKPAKGEILTLRIPGLAEDRVIHRGVWLAPEGNQLFKAGATYDWSHLNSQPTPEGRNEILSQLREFLLPPFEVVLHEAAVRPIHRNQYPAIGQHPEFPQLSYFNGLGSKGSLQAPFFADQLAQGLMQGGSLDPLVDLNHKTKWTCLAARSGEGRIAVTPSKSKGQLPLTQQAQDAVREVVQEGESAIDATMGNGYDTQFLAELVVSRGTVFALDVQQTAIDNTARRIQAAGLQNVILLKQNHAQLIETIPGDLHGRIAAVMFNLGYLPGGDKRIMTQADSTRRAITQATGLLRPGGILTVLAYSGHDGGAAEADAVEEILLSLSDHEFQLTTRASQPGRTVGPRLFIVQRRSGV